MKEIEASAITKTVAELCQQANFNLGDDVLIALREAQKTEDSPIGNQVLNQLIENAEVARKELMPLCQDCGTAMVFLELGQDMHITGGDLYGAIAEGVHQGYAQGYLRSSMVSQPYSARKHTTDNTPPVIHTEIMPGDLLKITVMPKGGGAENMSRLAMLKPSEGREGIIKAVVKTVDEGGSNACPPLIVGLGIGATADKAMLLAKKALLRSVGKSNPDPEVARLEKELLGRINDLGIGPMGLGGRTTALAVQTEVMPTHMASLPVAINLQCHSARHKEAVL